MKFHHLAYLVRDTMRSVESLKLCFPKVMLLKEAQNLHGAGSYITYMSTSDGKMVIELVEPYRDNVRLATRLDREKMDCIPYHICLEVDDFEVEYNRMRLLGWIPVTRPFSTSLGPKASHLYKPEAGIVEIVAKS